MDIAPPPNASPDEIQAWNNMMDTMVTFIKASTHLMNTITKKVRHGPGVPGGVADIIGGCEPECVPCQPKPPLPPCGGVCSAKKSPSDAKAPPASARPSASQNKPGSKQPSIDVTPPTPERQPSQAEKNAPEIAEISEEGGEAVGEGGVATEGEVAEGGEEEAEGVEATGEDNILQAPSTNVTPQAESTTVAPQAPSTTETPEDKKGDDVCTCEEIRAQREQENNKTDCICAEMKQAQEDEEAEPLCGCGPTPGNTQALVQEMVHKLAYAQSEIAQLQEELARLQRMNSTKRIGPNAGPNPALLYREIMKDHHRTPPPRQVCRLPPCPTISGAYPTPPPNQISKGPPGGYVTPPNQMIGRPPMPPQYFPGVQAPCRRTPTRSPSPDPYSSFGGSSMSTYDTTAQNPNYWSVLGDYGSPSLPMQRQEELTQMILCPSATRNETQATSPIKRRTVCGPPPKSSDCDPNCNYSR